MGTCGSKEVKQPNKSIEQFKCLFVVGDKHTLKMQESKRQADEQSVQQQSQENNQPQKCQSQISTVQPNSTHLQPPQKKKRLYVKGDLIDSGSFGQVYSGLDMETGQLLAIKTVKLSGNPLKIRQEVLSLKQEIGLIKKLSHKNIVKYMYTEIHDDMNAVDIVLEYIPGGSLRQLLNRIGRLEENVVRVYTRQILEGLDYLHEKGIIHRDLKCANLLIDTDGTIKLTDFGTSKKLATSDISDPSQNLSLKGSPFWMSPEVVQRKGHTCKADIWSIGGVVIEMLTGRPPYADEFTDIKDVLRAIATNQLPKFPVGIQQGTIQFLQEIYVVDELKRPTSKELLNTYFIKYPIRELDLQSEKRIEEYQVSRLRLKESQERNIKKRMTFTSNKAIEEESIIIVESKQNIEEVQNNVQIHKVDEPINSAFNQVQKSTYEDKQRQIQIQKLQRQKEWEKALQEELAIRQQQKQINI